MNTQNKSVFRWFFFAAYLGIISSMLACLATGIGSSNLEAGTLELENGSVAGTSTFDLVGALEGMDPWVVAGTTLETNEATQIEEGLEVGNLVRVRGTILEDGTWVAYSIELAEEQTDPIIILIGTVDSVDPWVVNGITLTVTADTVITGDIAPGMLVRVEILLLEDGTWEVLSITLLGDLTETEGCITVVATVVSVTEDEIEFLGWPAMPLGADVTIESGSEGDEGQGGVILSSNQNVMVVLCPSEDGQIVIVQIIIIGTPPDEGGIPAEGEKVLVCHKPNNKKGGHTLSISSSAVPAHLSHGDTMGPCP